MSIDSNLLCQVDDRLNKRYSDRLEKFGSDPRTLGWDTRAHQIKRFSAANRFIPKSATSIVDIGCGLADFYEYLDHKNRKIDYTGVDINPDLLHECKHRYPNNHFYCTNILNDDTAHLSAEWGVMFGVLNFRFDEFNNMEYAKQMIENAFSIVSDGLIVDMLSVNLSPGYPEEDFVYYYKPGDMLNMALEMTNNVMLVHDYEAIPQKEFFLVMRKESCKL